MSELKYGVDINLDGNELKNVRIENVATDPIEKPEGKIIYNTTSKTLKISNGSTWLTLGTGGVSGIQKYIQNIGDGSATGYTISHNLNTEDVTVSLYEGKKTVFAGIEVLDENSLKVSFSKAPTTNAVKVVVIG